MNLFIVKTHLVLGDFSIIIIRDSHEPGHHHDPTSLGGHLYKHVEGLLPQGGHLHHRPRGARQGPLQDQAPARKVTRPGPTKDDDLSAARAARLQQQLRKLSIIERSITSGPLDIKNSVRFPPAEVRPQPRSGVIIFFQKKFPSKFLILSTGVPRRRSPPKIAFRWRYPFGPF